MQVKSGKCGQLLTNDSGPSVPLVQFRSPLLHAECFVGGLEKRPPMSPFLCLFFFQKEETEREATTKPVQWNCSEGLGSGPNFVFGVCFSVCICDALE